MKLLLEEKVSHEHGEKFMKLSESKVLKLRNVRTRQQRLSEILQQHIKTALGDFEFIQTKFDKAGQTSADLDNSLISC